MGPANTIQRGINAAMRDRIDIKPFSYIINLEPGSEGLSVILKIRDGRETMEDKDFFAKKPQTRFYFTYFFNGDIHCIAETEEAAEICKNAGGAELAATQGFYVYKMQPDFLLERLLDHPRNRKMKAAQNSAGGDSALEAAGQIAKDGVYYSRMLPAYPETDRAEELYKSVLRDAYLINILQRRYFAENKKYTHKPADLKISFERVSHDIVENRAAEKTTMNFNYGYMYEITKKAIFVNYRKTKKPQENYYLAFTYGGGNFCTARRDEAAPACEALGGKMAYKDPATGYTNYLLPRDFAKIDVLQAKTPDSTIPRQKDESE
jgi:hypothetical protein